jgi:hypothetical protein
MLLNFSQVDTTPDKLYKHIPPKTSHQFTSISELIQASQAHQVKLSRREYKDRADALNNLRSNLDAGNPFIALVKYEPWRELTGNRYGKGHFVVVTGYDDTNIYMHDPLFGLWQARESGAYYPLSHADFCNGWGGFASRAENPNWVCVIPGRVADFSEPKPPPVLTPPPAVEPPPPAEPPPPVVVPPPVVTPPPAVEPPPVVIAPPPEPPLVPPPPVAEPPLPVSPPAPIQMTADIVLRIRALAAYRLAEAPDFNNPASVQLWLDHLGDWGASHGIHVVQSNDTLAGLAGRYYGEQHRWRAIQAYNQLNREGLWLGERVRIPHLGRSGAHLDPALPQDTLNMAKALELELLVDPDLPAQDYDEVGENSIGMGA